MDKKRGNEKWSTGGGALSARQEKHEQLRSEGDDNRTFLKTNSNITVGKKGVFSTNGPLAGTKRLKVDRRVRSQKEK